MKWRKFGMQVMPGSATTERTRFIRIKLVLIVSSTICSVFQSNSSRRSHEKVSKGDTSLSAIVHSAVGTSKVGQLLSSLAAVHQSFRTQISLRPSYLLISFGMLLRFGPLTLTHSILLSNLRVHRSLLFSYLSRNYTMSLKKKVCVVGSGNWYILPYFLHITMFLSPVKAYSVTKVLSGCI